MYPLFTTYACDFCDGLEQVDYNEGWIVYNANRVDTGDLFYVFKNKLCAAMWRDLQGLAGYPVRKVLTEYDLRWKTTPVDENIEIADVPFEIYSSHKYKEGPRAHLAD